jgi:hypothetical protein
VIPFLLYKQQTNNMNNIHTKTAATKVINTKIGDTNEKTLQKDSINNFVKEGKDFCGNKIPKKVIELSLKLESWVSNKNDLKLIDSFSDFPPSYMLVKKRVSPFKEHSSVNKDYHRIMEVFPRYSNGKEYFSIRDYRILSPYNFTHFANWSKKLTFEQLVWLIEREDLGIDMFEYMNLKNLKELNSETKIDMDELMSIVL